MAAVFVSVGSAWASSREAPGLFPELELVATACHERLSHLPFAFLPGAVGGLVADLAAPAGQVRELLPGVHLDPPRVALLARAPILSEALPKLAVAPHARQQRRDELAKVGECRGAQQEVRVGTGRCLRAFPLKLCA